jgi:uncharacterized repeat protein (TIGR01451 family)
MNMKKFYFLGLLLLVALSTTAQQGRFDVRFAVKTIDCATLKTVVQVQVKAHDANTTFLMGDANYRFRYDSRLMTNPTIISQENFSGELPANQSAYGSQNLNGSTAGPTVGQVSLNTRYAGRAGAITVGSDWTTVSCIGFDLVKISDCYSLTWNTDTSFPPTGMNEVVVTGTQPYSYSLVTVQAGGVFENLNVCPAQFCRNTRYGVRLSLKSFDCVTKKVVVLVDVKSPDQASKFLMGDANYRFQYDATKLRNPSIVKEGNFSSNSPANNPNYTAQDLNGSTTATTGFGVVSYNTKYNPPTRPGSPVSTTTTWTTVGCISFDYTGETSLPCCFDLMWLQSGNFPPTTMNEVIPGVNNYSLQIVQSAGIYQNLVICTAQHCTNQLADLSLRKTVSVPNSQTIAVGANVTFSLVLTNAGPDPATNVVVSDTLPATLRFVSSVPSLSVGAGNILQWPAATTLAAGASVTLTMQTQVIGAGTVFNVAEVTRADQKDPDSTPGNGVLNEDDYANACVAVPTPICEGVDAFLITANAGAGNVVWFRNGQQVGTGRTYEVIQAGIYTYTATVGNCPAGGCCPIIFVPGDCCPADVCVPFTIKKTRR